MTEREHFMNIGRFSSFFVVYIFIHLLAFFEAFRILTFLCLSTLTLKRSKSDRPFLTSFCFSFLAAFRILTFLCLSTLTLNRSKSDRPFLTSFCFSFLAQADFSQAALTSASSYAFLTAPPLAP